MGKNRNTQPSRALYGLSKIVGILLIPAAIFWLLFRHDLYSIIDAITIGIIASAGFVFGVKYLFTKKIIRFKK